MSKVPVDTRREGDRLLVIGLFVACMIAFFPALSAGFSDFDDVGFLIETEFWRGLSPWHLVEMFSTMRLGHYQPLTYLSHAIEYTLFGLNPTVFHFTNIALHATCAILVMRIAQRVMQFINPTMRHAKLGAFSIALLWALNPMRVESVAWITERRDVLSAALLLGAMLCYIRHATGSGHRWQFLFCQILLTLSLFSKAWGITFVAVTLLCDVLLFKRLPMNPLHWRARQFRGVLLEKVPFLALSIAFGLMANRAILEAGAGTVRDWTQWSLEDRISQAIYGLGFYAAHALVIFEHAALRELPASMSLTEVRVIVPSLVFAGVVTLLVRQWRTNQRRAELITLALMLFLVVVSPVLGLTQAGIQLVAERYSYLSTISLLVLCAPLLARAFDWRRTIVVCALVTILVTLGALTNRQTRVWGDTQELWNQSIESGEDGPIVRNYLARQLEKRGKFALATAEYRKSLAFDQFYGDSWYGLGNTLRAGGELDASLEAFAKALVLLENDVPVRIGEGLTYVAGRRFDEAIASFRIACDELDRTGNPSRLGRPYLLIAAAYGESGREDEAVAWLRKAALYPDSAAEASELLTEIEADKGR